MYVVSLSTRVPLPELIGICADALYCNADMEMDITILAKNSFRKLMMMATSGVEFSLSDCMYRQINGVTMGSQRGPALANIFVGYNETRIQQSELPELYHQLVDDVFSQFATNVSESLTFFPSTQQSSRFVGVYDGKWRRWFTAISWRPSDKDRCRYCHVSLQKAHIHGLLHPPGLVQSYDTQDQLGAIPDK